MIPVPMNPSLGDAVEIIPVRPPPRTYTGTRVTEDSPGLVPHMYPSLATLSPTGHANRVARSSLNSLAGNYPQSRRLSPKTSSLIYGCGYPGQAVSGACA